MEFAAMKDKHPLVQTFGVGTLAAFFFGVSACLFASEVSAEYMRDPDRAARQLLSDPRASTPLDGAYPPDFVQRVAAAARRQPELARARSSIEEADYLVDEAWSAWFPQINAGFEYRSPIEELDTRLTESEPGVDAVVSASQLIYDFGATYHRISAAKKQRSVSQAARTQTKEEIVLELVSAHYAVVRNTINLELAEQNLVHHRRTLAQLTEQLEGGIASAADRLRAESQVQSSKADVVSITGALRQAAAVYQELYFEPPENLRAYTARNATVQAPDQAIAQARTDNARLAAARASALAAQERAVAAKRDRLPELSLQLEATRFNVDDSERADAESFIFLSVDYPLFTGGAASARSGQAAARLRQQQSEVIAIEREIDRSIREIYADAARIDSQLVAKYLAVEAEKQTVAAYREQFGLGRRSLNDLIEAQQILFNAQRRLVDLQIQDRLIDFEIKALTGQLLADFELTS
jgi:adhesin transport system outer membrane protein